MANNREKFPDSTIADAEVNLMLQAIKKISEAQKNGDKLNISKPIEENNVSFVNFLEKFGIFTENVLNLPQSLPAKPTEEPEAQTNLLDKLNKKF